MAWRQMLGTACVILHILLSIAAVGITKGSEVPYGLPSVTYQPSTNTGDQGGEITSTSPTTTAAPINPLLKNSEKRLNYRPALGGRLPFKPLKPVESHPAQIIAAADETVPSIGSPAVLSSNSALATAPPLLATYCGSVPITANGSVTRSHAMSSSNNIRTSTSQRSPSIRSGSRHVGSSSKHRWDFLLAPSGSAKATIGPYSTGLRSPTNTAASSSGQPLGPPAFASGTASRYLTQSTFPTAGPYNIPSGHHGHARNSASGSATFVRPSAVASSTSANATIDTTLQRFPLQQVKFRKPSGRPFAPGSNGTAQSSDSAISNCSGVVTRYPATATKIITSTVLVNETITLTSNATTPAPVFITPLPACQTITSRCAAIYHGRCPHNFPVNPGNVPKIGPHLPPETTSTLLVTKKSPAIIHQGQAVGNIFGPTTTTQPIVTQPQAVRTPTETPQAQQTSIPGLSGAEIQVQSDGWSVSQSSDGGQSPGSTTPQQEPQAANAPPPVPNVDNMDSQQKDTGLNGGQASGEQISGGQTSGGQAGSGQPSVGSESPAPGGQVPAGQGSGTQASSDGRSDQTTSNGGSFPPGSRESSSALAQPDYSTPKQSASSQTVSEQSSSRGSSTSFHNENPGTVSSPPSGNRPPSGGTFGNDGKSVNENGSPQGSTDPLPNQYVPEIVTANGVHISIVPSAVIVGSQTINAGSPPTTFVVQGQIIAVQPSRILAAGATIPIEAAITPPPATSVDIGNVLVVMQPDNLLIGPQSFSHGSSAGTAIYNGQTYSWDADQLVGPGTTVAFPSAGTVPAPRITAAGQVFSVFPSHLKAAGLTLALPNTPEASAFVYKGQTFSINPSQLIAPDRSITTLSPGKPTPFVYGGNTFSVDASQFIAASTTIPLSAGSGVVTYKNEEIIVRPSQIAGPSITIALSAEPQAGVTATPSAITAGGVTFSLGPSAAVIGPSTYLFLPGQAPTTITSEGRKLGVGPKGVQIGTVNVPVPIESPNYSVVTEGGLTLSLAPTKLVLSGHTEDIRSGMSPIKTVIDGQTISIGPHGVGLGSTTIPLPTPKPSYQVVMEGDLTFSVAPSEAVIKGSTFAIGPDVPATMVMEGQTFSIGPHGIHFPGTTVDLPIVTSEYEPAVVTADGFKLSVGPTNAIIGSSDYPIGNGAHSQTIVVGSETVRLGAGGVMLPSTTIPPEQTPSAITANGLTFSADSSQALINGTAYQIGTEAMAMTVVAGSQTIELGTNGIVLPSTTIGPWGNATNSDASSVPGTDGALGAAPPTGLPGSGSSNWNGGPQHGAGTSLSPSDRLLSSIIISALMLALLLIS